MTKSIFSPVDILIPFHSQYHLLAECLESLITKTLGVRYTITLIDDGSPNKDFIVNLEKHKLKKAPIQYLRHNKQRGFGAALQTGFDKTYNDWVVFLHSDVRIEQTNWLAKLLNTLHDNKDKGVKLASAAMNEGGLGAYDERVLGKADCLAEQPLPLACALMHRQLFKHVGGFVKHYYPFGAEDLELFWRMKFYKFKQMVCGTSAVHHLGGATIKSLFSWGEIQKILDDNEKLFTEDIRALHVKKH